MEDETLNNVLNILQNTSKNTSNAGNNDLQNLLIKFLLSGGLNLILNSGKQKTEEQTKTPLPEKVRTIDLSNYQRLD